MRDVKYTTRFQRDYRREKSGRHSKKVDALLMEVVNLLAADAPLPRRNFDHPLSGEWNDYRDCHLRPSSTASRMTRASNLCASAHIVSLGSEGDPRSWTRCSREYPRYLNEWPPGLGDEKCVYNRTSLSFAGRMNRK
jgi:mRNA interferase YafQ